MSLISVVVVLIVVGVLLWLVNRYIPMDGTIKNILNAVVVIAVVLWLLQAFGLLHSLGGIGVSTGFLIVRWRLGALGWIFGRIEGWSVVAGGVSGLAERVIGVEGLRTSLAVEGRRGASHRAAFVQSGFTTEGGRQPELKARLR